MPMTCVTITCRAGCFSTDTVSESTFCRGWPFSQGCMQLAQNLVDNQDGPCGENIPVEKNSLLCEPGMKAL